MIETGWAILAVLVAVLVLAALFGAAKIAKAEYLADRWRRRALEADLALEKSRRAFAEIDKERAEAAPVEPFPVREGAEKYPFAAAAGLVAPVVDETHAAYMETVAADEQDEH